jgi:Flp pilus assembly protein TadG
MLRSGQRSQAVVEFGIIALLFTLLVFAVIDFGLLLNTWLAVSSGSRDIARSASVGKRQTDLQAAALKLNLPSIDPGSKLCCDSGSAVEVKIEYLPDVNGAPYGSGTIDSLYPYGDVDTKGGCPTPCTNPRADDFVKVTVIAHRAQVITPLVRPFFGCPGDQSTPCWVTLTSTTIMRFEGREF